MQNYARDVLVEEFQNSQSLSEVCENVIEKFEARHGGSWLVYIYPEKSASGLKYFYQEKCIKLSFKMNDKPYLVDIS